MAYGNLSETITPRELARRIKSGKIGGVYLFFGEEQYRLENAISAVIKKCVPKGTEAFNLFRFEGSSTSAAQIIEACDQYPQMSDMKVVTARNTGLLNNAVLTDFKLLANAEIPEDTCLIFAERDFDKKKLKNLDFIKESGGIVVFDHMTEKELVVLIEKRLREAGKSAPEGDILYMITLCGRSQAEIEQGIDKLVNYTGDRAKITREDIDAVIEKTVEYLVYDMIDSIVEKRGKKAWEQLDYLKKTAGGKTARRKTGDGKVVRIDPNHILGLIMGRLSEMLCCKLLKEDGLTPSEIGGYFDFPRPVFAINNMIAKSRDFDEAYLKEMLKKGLYYDEECKTGNLSPWNAVDMYMAELLK